MKNTDRESGPGFAERLIVWQRAHGRHNLPWQASREPYRAWLAEIMLQQTQVDTVIPYYQRFLARFPDVAALAAAPIDEVLALWSGLGYYARARNLHRAAQVVMNDFGGRFPASSAQLAELPGIGRSTAASIAAYCFGERAAILDGNVKRVLARHFGIEGFTGERAVESRLWALAESLLPDRHIDTYTQALMDMGATVCTRAKPLCLHCPLAESCVARREGRSAELPTPRPKRAVPQREATLLVVHDDGNVLLEKRPASGIWGGLYSLPELAAGESPAAAALRLGLPADRTWRPMDALRHVFTHFTLDIQPLRARLDAAPLRVAEGALAWTALATLDEVGLPAPVRRILAQLQAELD